jgi:hypothetical protein
MCIGRGEDVVYIYEKGRELCIRVRKKKKQGKKAVYCEKTLFQGHVDRLAKEEKAHVLCNAVKVWFVSSSSRRRTKERWLSIWERERAFG